MSKSGLIWSWRAGWGDIDSCCFAATLNPHCCRENNSEKDISFSFQPSRCQDQEQGWWWGGRWGSTNTFLSPLFCQLSFQITLFRNPNSVCSVSTSLVCLGGINSCDIKCVRSDSLTLTHGQRETGRLFCFSCSQHWVALVFITPVLTLQSALQWCICLFFCSPTPQSESTASNLYRRDQKASIHRRLGFLAKYPPASCKYA